MEPDVDTMRRAISKEFHARGGHYVFGKALPFGDWWEEKLAAFSAQEAVREVEAAAAAAAAAALAAIAVEAGGVAVAAEELEEGPAKPWLEPLLRGDCGSRQDISVEASWGSFHNRPFYVEFLHYVINEWKCTPEEKATILDNSLYVQLTSPTLVAADMVRAVLFDKCFRPLRILCNGVDLPEWHPLKMAGVADKLEKVFEAVSTDPMSIMEEDYECFSVVDFPVLEEKVARWKACRSISAIRQELYHPSDQTVIDARGECAGIIKAWATGILVSLRRNCKDYLTSTDGRYCEGKQTDEMVASARGMLA
jgi:hypothetical protein